MSNPSSDARQKIRQAAQAVFSREGFGAARTQQIADLAGVNKALLHYYYQTKDQLYAEVLNQASDQLHRSLAQAQANQALPDNLLTVGRSLLAYQNSEPGWSRFLLAELGRAGLPVLTQLDMHQLVLFRQLDEGVRLGLLSPADPRALLMLWLSICLAPTLWTLPLAQLSREPVEVWQDAGQRLAPQMVRAFLAAAQVQGPSLNP